MTDSVEANLARDVAGHPNADPVTEATVKRIVRIARQYENAMRRVTASRGVSLGDAEVIFELAHHDGPPLTPGQLARIFQITAGSMTSRLDRLEHGGYIERRIDPANRVNINVCLTPTGHRLHHDTVDDLIALRRRLITEALPAGDLAALNALLRHVLTHIENGHPSNARNAARPPRTEQRRQLNHGTSVGAADCPGPAGSRPS